MIIVEGIDRVGKTTLCNKLSENYKIPIYRHIGERNFKTIDNDIETEKFFQILEICKLSNAFIIFDRLYLSDYVYGTLERDYDIIKASNNLKALEDYIGESFNNIVLILVCPTDINESSRQHGKDLSKYNEIFMQLFKESNIRNKIMCDYNGIDNAVKFVGEKIRENI